MTAHSSETIYICPGDKHPISRSVHLSRLAAFYPKCRECALRVETGQLATQTVKRLQSTERRVARPSLFTADGVRGAYLNELSRTSAGQIAGALAIRVWNEVPVLGRTSSTAPRARREGPTVVVGHDERPSSPDIVTGIANVLRRMGCNVTDIGVTSAPCFWFAVEHLQAAAGIFATGSGCPPSWTGMDFFMKGPVSHGTGLEEIEALARDGYSRPTRRGGRQRTFQAGVPYEASLWKHFRSLQPLTVCCGCSLRRVRERLERLFAKQPCQLHLLELPNRARNPNDAADADVLRVSQAVRDLDCHLGILIDDDAQRCSFFDEQGRLVSTGDILGLLAGDLLANHRTGRVVLEPAAEELRGPLESLGAECVDGGENVGTVSKLMAAHGAILAGGSSGRFWFREAFPTSDAILTLAGVLEVVCQAAAPLSQIVESAKSLAEGEQSPAAQEPPADVDDETLPGSAV